MMMLRVPHLSWRFAPGLATLAILLVPVAAQSAPDPAGAAERPQTTSAAAPSGDVGGPTALAPAGTAPANKAPATETPANVAPTSTSDLTAAPPTNNVAPTAAQPPDVSGGLSAPQPARTTLVIPQTRWTLSPYAIIVGGLQQEHLIRKDGTIGTGDRQQTIEDDREDRVVTLAMSRIGLLGDLGEHVHLQSEIEVNRGPHGTSVWEGQAALQIRMQLVQLSWWRLSLGLGRILDESSVDFSSGHVADQLLMDPYTRQAMLEAGYNLGNGLRLGADLGHGLSAGITFNSANPTGMTGSYLIAGKYSSGLFSRFYRFAGSRIAGSPNKYPDDATHLMMLTPAVRWQGRMIEAQVAAQLFWANVDTNGDKDEAITGRNFRAGVQARFWRDRLHPFVNVSWVEHNTLAYESDEPTQTWEGEDWRTITMSGGLDLDLWGKSGLGVQVAHVASQQGDGTLIDSSQNWLNLGATWWITDTVALGGRLAFWWSDQQDRKYNNNRFEWEPIVFTEGERSIFFTLRKIL